MEIETNIILTDRDKNRFFSKIEKTNSCWYWIGTKDKYNYGVFTIKHQINIKHKLFKAHRISYMLHNGNFNKDLMVCHSCDNPECVNPEHLWLGTQADNNNDRHKKGRTKTGHLYGEENPKSKLKEDDIRWIRKNYNPKVWSTRKLAKRYGVCQTLIRNILSRKAWGWLK